MNVKLTIGALLPLLLLAGVALPAWAQDATVDIDADASVEVRMRPVIQRVQDRLQNATATREAVRVQTQERVETLREERELRQDERAEQQEARMEAQETRRTTRQEQASERVDAYLERIARRFDAALERLARLEQRLDSRIVKLEERGLNMADARAELTTATNLRLEAQQHLAEAHNSARIALESDAPRDAFAQARASFSAAKDALKQAHGALINAVASIKVGIEASADVNVEITTE